MTIDSLVASQKILTTDVGELRLCEKYWEQKGHNPSRNTSKPIKQVHECKCTNLKLYPRTKAALKKTVSTIIVYTLLCDFVDRIEWNTYQLFEK